MSYSSSALSVNNYSIKSFASSADNYIIAKLYFFRHLRKDRGITWPSELIDEIDSLVTHELSREVANTTLESSHLFSLLFFN